MFLREQFRRARRLRSALLCSPALRAVNAEYTSDWSKMSLVILITYIRSNYEGVTRKQIANISWGGAEPRRTANGRTMQLSVCPVSPAT